MKIKFTYGDVLGEPSEIFRKFLYENLNIKKLFKDKNLLDLGCGFGFDTINFSKISKNVSGADSLRYKTWDNFNVKNIRFVKTFSEKLPFKNNEFNAIYMKDLLHHVNNVDQTLEVARRVTSNGAIIIILEGNRYNPIFYFLVTKWKGHEHFSQRDFKKKILKYFPNSEFKYLEAYPPFFLNKKLYKLLIYAERYINKIKFLTPLFSYNIAVIKVKK